MVPVDSDRSDPGQAVGWTSAGLIYVVCLNPDVVVPALAVQVVYLFVVVAVDPREVAWPMLHRWELVVKHLEVVSALGRRSSPAMDCWERSDGQLRP